MTESEVVRPSKVSTASLREKLVVCQHVARLVRARLPISKELTRSTAGSTSSVAQIAEEVDLGVTQGKSLASVLAGDNRSESRILAACIEAGEISQRLDFSLESWAGMHIANAKTAQAMRAALVYPFALIAVTILALGFMVWELIPEYQSTYEMFDQDLPAWLNAIVSIRERFGMLQLGLLLLSLLPLFVWYLLRQRRDRFGQPVEFTRRCRLQALATEMAAVMLEAQIPLKRIADVSARMGGASADEAQQAFSRLQNQQPAAPLSRETSMLLASLQAGIIPLQDACDHLHKIAQHLRRVADIAANRQARWIPMLVALTVGFITVGTYVFLIYLPWIWLLQSIVAPEPSAGL